MPPPLSFDRSSSKEQHPPKICPSCDTCQAGKIRCSKEKPACRRCIDRGLNCHYSFSRRRGRPRKNVRQSRCNAQERLLHEQNNGEQRRNSTSTITTHGTQSPAPQNAPPWLEAQHANPTLNDTFAEGHSEDFSDIQRFLLDPQMTFDSEEYGGIFCNDGHNESSGLLLKPTYQSVAQDSPRRNFLDSWQPHRADILAPSSVDTRSITHGVMIDDFHGESLSLMNTNNRPRQSVPFQTQALEKNGDQNFKEHDELDTSRRATGSLALLTPLSSTPRSSYSQSVTTDSSIPGSRNDVCTRACHDSILKKLGYVEQGLSGLCLTTLDSILELEKEIQFLKRQIMNCAICFRRHSVLLMLVSVVERTVYLFERKYGTAEMNYTQRKVSRSQHMGRRLGKKLNDTGTSKQKIGSAVIDECSLHIGIFEVRNESKVGFLKSLVKMRLRRLCTLVCEIQATVTVAPEDCNSRATQEIANDVIKRLLSLTGWVELWE